MVSRIRRIAIRLYGLSARCFTCVAVALWLSAAPGSLSRAEDGAPVTYIEYRLQASWIQADSFDANVRRLWRHKNTRLRLEEPDNPQTGIHGLVVVNAPDTWLVDRKTNRGRHFVDPGPTYNVVFPALAFGAPAEAAGLQMGSEVAFFTEKGAVDGGERSLDGVPCNTKVLNFGDTELRLWLDKLSGRPRQLELRNDKLQYAVRFDIYRNDLVYDPALFTLPEGVEISAEK